VLDQFDQVLESAAKAIKSPNHKRVVGAQVVDARLELGTMLERPRPSVAADPKNAGVGERVELQVETLHVSRHTRVANQRGFGTPTRTLSHRSASHNSQTGTDRNAAVMRQGSPVGLIRWWNEPAIAFVAEGSTAVARPAIAPVAEAIARLGNDGHPKAIARLSGDALSPALLCRI
jgi:hypothetical protein